MIMTRTSRPASPRRFAWGVASVFLMAGIVGFALVPMVAAHTRTFVQVIHAWLCSSLVAAAFVVVSLANDHDHDGTEG
jgi:fucose permease